MERTACFEILSKKQKLLTRDENGYIFINRNLKNEDKHERIKTIKDIDRINQNRYKYNITTAIRITHPQAPHKTTIIPAFWLNRSESHLNKSQFYRTYFFKKELPSYSCTPHKQDKKTNLITLEKRILQKICPKRYPHHIVNTKNPPKYTDIDIFLDENTYSRIEISSKDPENKQFGRETFQKINTKIILYLNREKTKTLYIPNERFGLNSHFISEKISNMHSETEHTKLTMLHYILPHIDKVKQTLKERTDMLIAEANQS